MVRSLEVKLYEDQIVNPRLRTVRDSPEWKGSGLCDTTGVAGDRFN